MTRSSQRHHLLVREVRLTFRSGSGHGASGDASERSTSGQGVRVIGYSIIADDIVTVIVLEHDGTEYGVNGWSANAKDRRIYNEGSYDSEDGEGR